MSNNTNNIKVAVRVRPLITSEIKKGCQDVINVIDPAQVVIKSLDKVFTFSYAFGAQSQQSEVYDKCVKHMIDQLFKGYNVTILAYGQTGSGKTHSMGTNYNGDGDMGVIPRAVQDIFNFIKDNFTMDINVSCSFVELYNEVLFDLLSEKSREHRTLGIREDTIKGFHIPGITEIPVSNITEVLTALAKGSIGRAAAQTNMNMQSSRSHAIFTISIFMQNKNDKNINKMAKLYLVDLAGSERQKKTGAVGTTLRESININRGLFALANVISCLGEEKKQQSSFIPYRESNLTKLLKDSLGGNSYTLILACVSPADYNTEETLSTLQYADKVLKIKNNPVVNEDRISAEINVIKKTIQQPKLQLVEGDKSKFDNIQSMAEAKLALKSIFDEAFDKLKQDLLSKNTKVSELVNNNVVLNVKVDELSKNLKQIQEKHAAEVREIEQNFESKISLILDELREIKSSGEYAYKKLEDISNTQREEIEQLKDEIKNLQSKNNSATNFLNVPEISFGTPAKKAEKMKKEISKSKNTDFENKENELEESIFSDSDDDTATDPDWRKTPLAKRIRQEKRNLFLRAMAERAKTKRSSEAGCTCKTNCNSRCGCMRLNRPCSSNCKCDGRTCLNMTNSKGDTSTATEENSLKKPRLDAAMEESPILLRPTRRARQIFTRST